MYCSPTRSDRLLIHTPLKSRPSWYRIEMQKERLFGLRGLDMLQDVLDEIVREEFASAIK